MTDVIEKQRVTDQEYLNSKGWRLIGSKRSRLGGYTKYYSHPDHQPARHGAFSQTSALSHQKRLDKGGRCNCVPEKPGL